MQDKLLVGIWSEDCIYGPGAQSDTVLVFLPDKTGVTEEWNFGHCAYELCIWESAEDGTLTLTRTKSVSKDDAGQIVEEPCLFASEQRLFSIALEEVPKGGIAEVLTIVRCYKGGLLRTEKYGRFTEGQFSQDTTNYQLPF